MATPPPDVPADRLTDDGWVRIEDTTDTLADLPGVTVNGHTLVYGDQRLRAAVADATDSSIDQPWRFFFATRLGFEPPPPPGVGPTMFGSIVRSRAKAGFADRLCDRGFEALTQAHSERLRIATGERARLTGYDAVDRIETGRGVVDLPVKGWVGVWHHDSDFLVAGGAYPARPLAGCLDIDIATDPGEYRSELFSLLRAVA